MTVLLLTMAGWLGVAAVAALAGPRLGLSIAVLEILFTMAVVAVAGLAFPPLAVFLATAGAIMVAFLAGAEVDLPAMRENWRDCLRIGGAAFFAPYVPILLYARHGLGLDWPQAQIVALALAETSIAVTYVLVVESGLNRMPVGRLILASVLVTNLFTIAGLTVFFLDLDAAMIGFVLALAAAVGLLPRVFPAIVAFVEDRPGSADSKLILMLLAGLAGLATAAKVAVVVPAYFLGIAMSHRLREMPRVLAALKAIAFSGLTSFYFMRVGTFVDLDEIGMAPVLVLFALKFGTKAVAVWLAVGPTRMAAGWRLYTTLAMATGLTFGSFAALFGLNEGLIGNETYSILLLVIVASAVLPALAAQALRTRLTAAEAMPATAVESGPARDR